MSADAPAQDPPARRLLSDGSSEIVSAFLLSLAALVSTWSSYQASLWDGEQAAYYTKANALRIDASFAGMRAGQLEGGDMLMFTQWLDAFARDDAELQEFYRRRFRPEFARPFERWLALKPRKNPEAPPTPFAMQDYRAHDVEEARIKQREADALFGKGQRANDISDAFVNGTLFLAMALFVCGIVQTFESPRVRMVLLLVGALACAAGIVRVITLPALQLG